MEIEDARELQPPHLHGDQKNATQRHAQGEFTLTALLVFGATCAIVVVTAGVLSSGGSNRTVDFGRPLSRKDLSTISHTLANSQLREKSSIEYEKHERSPRRHPRSLWGRLFSSGSPHGDVFNGRGGDMSATGKNRDGRRLSSSPTTHRDDTSRAAPIEGEKDHTRARAGSAADLLVGSRDVDGGSVHARAAVMEVERVTQAAVHDDVRKDLHDDLQGDIGRSRFGGGDGGGENQPHTRHGRNHRALSATGAGTKEADGHITIPSLAFERSADRSPDSVAASASTPTTGKSGGKSSDAAFCSPLEVTGLDACPQVESSTLAKLLAAKADMLRDVVAVLTDPSSAGIGGDPDEPLLLVQKLALDETDAVFGAFESRFMGVAPDAGAWSPLPGGFNRWVERYHREILQHTRPVIITVHGDDVCAVERELSLEARMLAAGIPAEEESGDQIQQDRRRSRELPGRGENFEVPVVLVTLGWDPAGDPTHREDASGRDRTCVFRVLQMPRVVRWFTSHTRYDSHTDAEKFRYLPIGFGGYETRNGLPQSAYVDAARRQLKILETCPMDRAGRYDLLFQCNSLDRDPRTAIWSEMTEKTLGPIPINYAPLASNEMVVATAKGIFAVSPPGTGPDCFRHYEMMLEGNIVMVPDVYSLRRFMRNLPAFFFGHGEAWGSLTCERLLEMGEIVHEAIGKGEGMQYEKLTHGFWRGYIRRETLLAGGVSDEDAPYVERSMAPLDPPGWKTFREIGCYSRSPHNGDDDPTLSQAEIKHNATVRLEGSDRSPEGCAQHCSSKHGRGVAFFGISDGDRCWCGKNPGTAKAQETCDINCRGDEGGGRCGGDARSTVYVFGPEDEGAPFEYVGCFPAGHQLMYHAKVHFRKSNTPFLCEAFCTSLRYPYFALENSNICRCGVLTANTPRSVSVPAFIRDGGYEPVPGPPNADVAGEPVPSGVRVGDSQFECHKGRCSGNKAMWGCGTAGAYDLYKNTDPCVLYRDCRQ